VAMPDILTIILLFTGLIILLMLPNIKIVRKDEVMIIERLGSFHKILDLPGIYFLVPLLDRNIQTVSTKKQHIKKKLTIHEDEEIIKTLEISYYMTIIDPKTYVYASLDSNDTIHTYIKEALEAHMDKKEIICEAIDYAETYGFKIEELNFE
jgi:regulator of protease activity HflC (stomatin/prohibitin superfamily)